MSEYLGHYQVAALKAWLARAMPDSPRYHPAKAVKIYARFDSLIERAKSFNREPVESWRCAVCISKKHIGFISKRLAINDYQEPLCVRCQTWVHNNGRAGGFNGD